VSSRKGSLEHEPAKAGADTDITRREALGGIAGSVGAVIAAGLPLTSVEQGAPASAPPAAPTPQVASGTPARLVGAPTSAIGARSPFATPAGRTPVGSPVGSSLTPLHSLSGTITPSDLHFERHHAGVPTLDPATHRLVIHGLVDRPLSLTVDDIRRFPQVTRVHFVECSGNSRPVWLNPTPDMTPQRTDGLTSNSEWTGVPVATLFREAGAQSAATWFLAEGGDACLMTRSIPMEKALDDALIVWAQNGEPLRPEQGFPLRLLLPGWEGNTNVKWLRRLELGTQPWMTRWETSKYTDPLKDGTARIFSFVMDAKSIITSPAVPAKLESRGWRPVSGIAWSGRGRITKVEISADNGATWHDAEIQGPALPKAHTRFTMMWNWDGRQAILLSRATDETGYVQPSRKALMDARGVGTDYHNNAVRGWRVEPDGSVFFHWETT
jgi:sulfane dehydrogenase subunit SoxC